MAKKAAAAKKATKKATKRRGAAAPSEHRHGVAAVDGPAVPIVVTLREALNILASLYQFGSLLDPDMVVDPSPGPFPGPDPWPNSAWGSCGQLADSPIRVSDCLSYLAQAGRGLVAAIDGLVPPPEGPVADLPWPVDPAH